MDSRAIIAVVDNLTSTSATDALSANQGRVLKELIDNEVDTLSTTIEALKNVENISDANLNEQIGRIIFGYGNDCTNRPTGAGNGYLLNLAHPGYPTSYNIQYWQVRNTKQIYTRRMENNVWNDWSLLTNTDSGWLDITLSGNVQAYSSGTQPQYRKIGNVVYLRGAVKNITAANTTIGVLPTGYRPISMSHNYIQLTSAESDSPNFARLKVGTDGAIVMEAISTGITATYNSADWYPINTSYIVD